MSEPYHVHPAGSKTGLKVTVDQQTDDGSAVVSSSDASLPRGGDVLDAIGIRPSEALEVGGVRKEVVDQANVHALHDQGQAEEHAVDNGGPVPREELLTGNVGLLVTGRYSGLDELHVRSVYSMFRVLGPGFARVRLDFSKVWDAHDVCQ